MPRIGQKLPQATFRMRVRDDSIDGPNPFRWETRTTDDFFAGRRAVLFSLPGAFTPTCSTYQLPNFEKLFSEFQKNGIEKIYCLSVNDAFVMNKWGRDQGVENIELVPDGAGEFTRKMGMLVEKNNLGFGLRSWRYAAVVDDGVIVNWFEEPGLDDNVDDDPYGVSSPENILSALANGSAVATGHVQEKAGAPT